MIIKPCRSGLYRAICLALHLLAVAVLAFCWTDLPVALRLFALSAFGLSLLAEWRRSRWMLRISDSALEFDAGNGRWQSAQVQTTGDFSWGLALGIELAETGRRRHLLVFADCVQKSARQSLRRQLLALGEAARLARIEG